MDTDQIHPIIAHFYKWEKEKADDVFLRQPKGSSWREMTWKEVGHEARCLSEALQQNGVGIGDHVGIYSKNCCHWIIADIAIMMAGGVSVPYYASLPKDQLKEVVALSDVKVIFVGKLDEWGDKHKAIPEEVTMIRFPHYEGNARVKQGLGWEDILKNYAPIDTNYVPDLDDLWTIKFTSGTTGTPKGVMHIHQTPALIMQNEVKTGWLQVGEIEDLRCLSFLPLNHVGERLGLEVPCIIQGGTISFAESLDTFAQNLRDTQPTLFFAVPRIWMKFYMGVIAKMPQKKMDRLFSIPIVSGMVKKKILKAMGLDKVQVAATGAAITPEFVKEWYSKLGIHLIEAYGMTEVCGSMCNSPMLDAPPDSVGKAIPFGEVKVDPVSQEILMKSPYMMTGYYKNPEKTEEVLKEGWIHSGDRGTIDSDGFVRVIGRVKDAFKTSKGSFVTPNPMEEVISQNEYVEQCCVVGLGIPQPICLVNLSELGKTADNRKIGESLLSQVKELNGTLANYARISTVVINKEDWSEANQLLTPTLKVKRGSVDDRYGKQYLNWHEAKDKVIWA